MRRRKTIFRHFMFPGDRRDYDIMIHMSKVMPVSSNTMIHNFPPVWKNGLVKSCSSRQIHVRKIAAEERRYSRKSRGTGTGWFWSVQVHAALHALFHELDHLELYPIRNEL